MFVKVCVCLYLWVSTGSVAATLVPQTVSLIPKPKMNSIFKLLSYTLPANYRVGFGCVLLFAGNRQCMLFEVLCRCH